MRNTRLTASLILALVFAFGSSVFSADGGGRKGVKSDDGWIALFDGETLNGWKASENKSSWRIIDGSLAAKGPRSHLFYDGGVSDHTFRNFELSVDVKAEGDANAGIYFHTKYQEKGWPDKGFEFQVVNSTFSEHSGQNNYIERKKTGSLYGVRNIGRSPVKNDEWFNYRITVRGKTIRSHVNGRLMVDYTEPENPYLTKDGYRVLSEGTFAFQCHDPKSSVYFKNIKVRPLPDNATSPGKPLEDANFERRLRKFGQVCNLPTTDFHVHLENGLSTEQLLRHARKYGFTYGVAFRCGLNTSLRTEKSLRDFLDGYDRAPETFLGMQAEGRDWAGRFSKETINRFDYVLTDAMAWADDAGEISDPEKFMDQLVDTLVGIVSKEPIDIYANATYLPAAIRNDYDSLWTEERMDAVIRALAEKGVAVEISARFRIPSARFVRKAKAAGVKFTFGSDNTGPQDLGRLDYCLRMAEECKLKRLDFWFPN